LDPFRRRAGGLGPQFRTTPSPSRKAGRGRARLRAGLFQSLSPRARLSRCDLPGRSPRRAFIAAGCRFSFLGPSSPRKFFKPADHSKPRRTIMAAQWGCGAAASCPGGPLPLRISSTRGLLASMRQKTRLGSDCRLTALGAETKTPGQVGKRGAIKGPPGTMDRASSNGREVRASATARCKMG